MHRNTVGQAEPGTPPEVPPTQDLAKAQSAAMVGSGIALAGTIGGAFTGGYVARGSKWPVVVLASMAGAALGGVVGGFTGGAVATAIVS